MKRRARPWFAALALGVATTTLHAWRLSEAPIYVSPDEAIISVDAQSLATSGADFARGVQWGAYDGSLFVAQLKESDLRRFTFAGAVATQRDIFFNGTYGRIRTARQGPDGSLYLTTSNGSNDQVIRITPTQ